MIYLSGAWSAAVLADPRPDLGLMYQPGMGNDRAALASKRWAGDNGCYAQGERFNPTRWLDWLETLTPYRETCLFAVAPDVVGDAEATLARSLPYLAEIEARGFPPAFVTQDGCRADLVPWDRVRALFVGGTNAWKLSEASWALCADAAKRGLWTHMGRCNSYRRLAACATAGLDSADGTFLSYGPDVNWPRLVSWLDGLAVQPSLGLEAAG